MLRLSKLCGLAVLFGLTLSAVSADDPKQRPGGDKSGKDAALMLEGGYTIVSGEEDGKAIPPERIKGAIVRFTTDEVVGTDKDKKQIFVTKFTLDSSTKPYRILMKSTVPAEHETTGLIEKQGETIRLIYALPGGQPPTDFKTKEKQQMFVLKSINTGTRTGGTDK